MAAGTVEFSPHCRSERLRVKDVRDARDGGDIDLALVRPRG